MMKSVIAASALALAASGGAALAQSSGGSSGAGQSGSSGVEGAGSATHQRENSDRSTPYPYDPNSPQTPAPAGGGDTGGDAGGVDAARPYGTYDGNSSGSGASRSPMQNEGSTSTPSVGSTPSQSGPGGAAGGGATGSSGGMTASERFRDLDADRSGGLSLAEVQAYSTDVSSDSFSRYDRNGDGSLSKAEYNKWMKSK